MSVDETIMAICLEYSPRKPGMAKRIRKVVDDETGHLREANRHLLEENRILSEVIKDSNKVKP